MQEQQKTDDAARIRWRHSTRSSRAGANSIFTPGHIEVTIALPLHLKGRRVFIERQTYETFVAWGNAAMHLTGVYLDEKDRLHALLEGCVFAADGQGGCFVLRVMNSQDRQGQSRREVFTLDQIFTPQGEKAWLIAHCA